jgi:hypothetical protein
MNRREQILVTFRGQSRQRLFTQGSLQCAVRMTVLVQVKVPPEWLAWQAVIGPHSGLCLQSEATRLRSITCNNNLARCHSSSIVYSDQ